MSRSLFAPDGTEVSCRCSRLPSSSLPPSSTPPGTCSRSAPLTAGPAFVFAYNLFACLVYLPWVGWLLVYGAQLEPAGRGLSRAERHHSSRLQPVPAARLPGRRSLGGLPDRARHRAYAVVDRRIHPAARDADRAGHFGLLAVVAGIGFITTQGELSAFRQPRGLDGVRWGTATGSLIAGYTVVDGYGVKVLGIHRSCSTGLQHVRFFMLLPVVLSNLARAREKMKGHWWLAFGVGAAVAAVLHPRAQPSRWARRSAWSRPRAKCR